MESKSCASENCSSCKVVCVKCNYPKEQSESSRNICTSSHVQELGSCEARASQCCNSMESCPNYRNQRSHTRVRINQDQQQPITVPCIPNTPVCPSCQPSNPHDRPVVIYSYYTKF